MTTEITLTDSAEALVPLQVVAAEMGVFGGQMAVKLASRRCKEITTLAAKFHTEEEVAGILEGYANQLRAEVSKEEQIT